MGSLTDQVQEIEQEEILNALKECNWIMSRAARKLGITERMIGYKIRKYNIRKETGNNRWSQPRIISVLPRKI
jgi:transcriptional regulator with GAF, ATPase, and Fis domain